MCINQKPIEVRAGLELRKFVMKWRADMCCSFCRTIRIVQLSYFFVVCTVVVSGSAKFLILKHSVMLTHEAKCLSLSHHMSF